MESTSHMKGVDEFIIFTHVLKDLLVI